MDKDIKRKPRREAERDIDEQVEESFPASDPPSYTAPKRVGTPQRKRDSDPDVQKRSAKP
jgi:hypothetical protein